MSKYLTNHNTIQRYFPAASKKVTEYTSTISIPLYGDYGDDGDENDVYCLFLSKLFFNYTLVTITKISDGTTTNLVLTAVGNKTITMDTMTDLSQQMIRMDDPVEYVVVFDNNGRYTITPLADDRLKKKSSYPGDLKYPCTLVFILIAWLLFLGWFMWLTN
jgi:hypothetical protein